MIQFSYMILRLYDQGNFTMETELARRKFETQANEKLIALKGIYDILVLTLQEGVPAFSEKSNLKGVMP